MSQGPRPEPTAPAAQQPPSPSSPLDADRAPEEGLDGPRVVLGLFVFLAACVVFIFTVFSLAVRPEDREWVPQLTFRYLYMPVVATGFLVAIDAYRLQRKGWWVYLLMAPVPFVNIVLDALWIMKWRHGEPVGPLRM